MDRESWQATVHGGSKRVSHDFAVKNEKCANRENCMWNSVLIFGLVSTMWLLSLFLTVLEDGSIRSGCKQLSAWWKPCSCFINSCFLLCSHTAKGVKGSLRPYYFIRAPIPFTCYNHLPKAPFTNTIIMRIWLQRMKFWEDTDLQSVAVRIQIQI